jgi:hypothetical protein
MKHEYKVGDKVRMLEDYSDLVEGEVYRVEIVGRGDENLPIQVGEHGDWPMVGTYELVTEEDNKDLLENRITYDKDTGLNPVIEVEGEQDDNT